MSDITKAVEQVRTARWEAWRKMASGLPDHRILSIEMLRTGQNETLAVFTVVKDGRPVQYALRGNTRGADLQPLVTRPSPPSEAGPFEVDALVMVAPVAAGSGPGPLPGPTPDDGVTAASIAMGEPPPKQPPPQAIVALGTSLLTTGFNLGEVAVRAA